MNSCLPYHTPFRKATLLLVWLGMCATLAPAQESKLPVETVGLQVDRRQLIAGETLWFSASCAQSTPTAIPLSTTLYLEILNGKGQAVVQQKHAIENQLTSGGVEIPETLPTGIYFLRAYTQYQRNFPPESFTSLDLVLLNPTLPPEKIVTTDSMLAFRFEGSGPLENVRTRLVVQLPAGSLSPDSLRLVNSLEQVIARPAACIGQFCMLEVVMEPTQIYSLAFRDTMGRVFTRKLPLPQPIGLNLAQVRTAGGYQLTLFPTQGLMEARKVRIQVLGPDFRVVFSQEIDLVSEGLTPALPASAFQEGTNYLIVTSTSGKPLYASVCPWSTTHANEAGVELPARVIAPRTEGQVSLDLPEPGPYTFTLRRVPPAPEDQGLQGVWSNPWLFASLKSENLPEGAGASMAHVLTAEYLLRHYADLTRPSAMFWVPESRDLGVSGTVRDRTTQAPVSDVFTMVSVVGEHPQVHGQLTQSDGSFRLPLRDLEGVETVFIGVKATDRQELEVQVNRDFAKETPEIRPVPMRYDPALHRYYEELYVSSQAGRLFETPATSPLHPVRRQESLPVNLGQPDFTVEVDDFIELLSMEELLRNLVPKVSLLGQPGYRHLAIYDELSLSTRHDPLILLDYAGVFDVEKLLGLPAKKIARFEVYTGDYFLGDQLLGGIISIFTHTDDFARYPFGADGAFVKYNTLQPGTAFEAVLPGTSALPHQPDFRTVLYWNPAMKAGKHTLSFVAPDGAGEYEVVVKPLSALGAQSEQRAVFQVED